MTQKSHLSLACVVTIGIGLSLVACSGSDTPRSDSAPSSGRIASGSAAPSASESRIDYAAVLRDARSQYTYGPPSKPIKADKPDEFDPTDPGPDADMELSTATPGAGESRQYVIIARIVSNMDVPKFGVLKDTNYVWEDRTNPDKDKWDLYVIPQDSPLKPKKLKKGKAFTGGTHPGIHLVKAKRTRIKDGKKIDAFDFGLCTDDCPSGHCGYQ